KKMPLGGLTIDVIEEELSDFSCKFDGEQEFVDKMNGLSQQLHLEADDLINEVMAYAANVKKTDLDVAFLEAFEQHYKKKKTPGSVSKPRPVLADLKPTTLGTPRRMTKLDISHVEIDDNMDTTLSKIETDAPAHVTEFAMIESSFNPTWFVSRKESGKVVVSMGGDVKRERRSKKAPFSVSMRHSVRGKYGEPKAADVLEGMNARLEAYGVDVRASNAAVLGDAPYASLVQETESPVFILGFVGDFDAKGDMSTIELMRDEAEGAVAVTVDVTGLDERCFFPGQMAVFGGVNRTGSLFEATSRLLAGKQPAATVQSCSEDAVIWVAAGPFTAPSTAAYEPLAEIVYKAIEEQPDVLVLVGPLVDRQSPFLLKKECRLSDDELTKGLLQRLGKAMKGCPTRVLFMPSSARDSCVIPVFPGCSLREEWKGEGIEIVTDPCTVVVGGAEVAITASEIVTHLSRAESHTSSNKENTDRMGRLAGHILEQRSLYPLYPPSLAASLDGLHSACALSGKQPHVIVAPSMLIQFVKSSFGAVIVNPGTACKGTSVGTFLKMRLGLSEIPDGGAVDLQKYTNASIVKI
ncbi:hypothetical protein PMAYCL1PPCAC_10122, partial [Pristionchus mayeri]